MAEERGAPERREVRWVERAEVTERGEAKVEVMVGVVVVVFLLLLLKEKEEGGREGVRMVGVYGVPTFALLACV